MFDEIAKQIGWIVIGAAVFYVVGKAIISHGDAEDQKKGSFSQHGIINGASLFEKSGANQRMLVQSKK